MFMKTLTAFVAIISMSLFLSVCGGGGGGAINNPPPGTTTYTVGGTVSGLTGTVVVQVNGGNDHNITSNGTYTFNIHVPQGTHYDVTVKTQPVGQQCMVTNGSGTINGSSVTNVALTCVNVYSIGGTVTGLTGSVVLQNNGGNNLALSSNGAFTISTSSAQGANYNVTVLTHPSLQTCTVSYASGTVGTSNITDIDVTCGSNTYTVGGALFGLSSGKSVVLKNSDGQQRTLTANGGFTFPNALADGSPYDVSILTQPTGTGHSCVMKNSTAQGSLAGQNVSTVKVFCKPALIDDFRTCDTSIEPINGTNSGTWVAYRGTAFDLYGSAGVSGTPCSVHATIGSDANLGEYWTIYMNPSNSVVWDLTEYTGIRIKYAAAATGGGTAAVELDGVGSPGIVSIHTATVTETYVDIDFATIVPRPTGLGEVRVSAYAGGGLWGTANINVYELTLY